MAIDRSVKQLTSEALSIVAPDEVFLVESYDPEKRANGAAARGPQGFGASEAILLLLPFINSFFVKYVEALGTEAGKKSFGAIDAWLSKKDEARLLSARAEIQKALVEGGMPTESIEASTDAIIITLSKG